MTTSTTALRYALRQVCDDLRRHDPESRALAFAEGVMAASGAALPKGPVGPTGRPLADPVPIVAAYQAGATIEGAGRAAGVSANTAARALARAGIPRRRYTRTVDK